MNLTDINTVKRVLGRHGFSFQKSLGQNFIIDDEVCPEMAKRADIGPDDGVLEIGPGIGVLTVELSKRAKKVVSVEIDTRLIPVLAETLSECRNVIVINDDVMKLDLKALLAEQFPDMKVHVVANLPYYITSPIIMHLLEAELPIEDITVMVQSEAAQRLCAKVGSRDAGAVTVAVDYYAEAKRLFFVGRDSFMPAPKVDSEVISLKLRKQPPVEVKDEKFFFDTVRAAFSQRRKTAVNSIGSLMGIPKEKIVEALQKVGLPATARAEALTMSQLAELANELSPGR